MYNQAVLKRIALAVAGAVALSVVVAIPAQAGTDLPPCPKPGACQPPKPQPGPPGCRIVKSHGKLMRLCGDSLEPVVKIKIKKPRVRAF